MTIGGPCPTPGMFIPPGTTEGGAGGGVVMFGFMLALGGMAACGSTEGCCSGSDAGTPSDAVFQAPAEYALTVNKSDAIMTLLFIGTITQVLSKDFLNNLLFEVELYPWLYLLFFW